MRVHASLGVLLVTVPLLSQTPPAVSSAGGKWTYYVFEDKLTGNQTKIFYLNANEIISDGIASGVPSLHLECHPAVAKPKLPQYYDLSFNSPVVLGTPLPEKRFGHYQQPIRIRTDSKIQPETWYMLDDFHTMEMLGSDARIKAILNSTDLRVAFNIATGTSQVAMFSPAGLDHGMVIKQCGNVFK
jgi:hypothetical protein